MKIAISYRPESFGKASFFDHFTLRAMTGIDTVICKPDDIPTTLIANYINLRAGDPTKYPLPLNSNIPETVADWAEHSGLIFLPGYTRDSDNKQPGSHKKRMAYEQTLISKARLRGQPVMAVCAGSWTLWEAFGGTVKEVADHNYGGAMPRLSTRKALVCNNKMIHKVVPVEHTYLSGAASGCAAFAVNSVHWKAPDEEASQEALKLLEISAHSQKDDVLAPNSRQGRKMQPEDCIEGFETISGVPMIGTQWHPEAFNPNKENAKKHKAIFSFMVGAGQTYLNRKQLNEEFKQKVNQSRFRFFTSEPENSGRDLPENSAKLIPSA